MLSKKSISIFMVFAAVVALSQFSTVHAMKGNNRVLANPITFSAEDVVDYAKKKLAGDNCDIPYLISGEGKKEIAQEIIYLNNHVRKLGKGYSKFKTSDPDCDDNKSLIASAVNRERIAKGLFVPPPIVLEPSRIVLKNPITFSVEDVVDFANKMSVAMPAYYDIFYLESNEGKEEIAKEIISLNNNEKMMGADKDYHFFSVDEPNCASNKSVIAMAVTNQWRRYLLSIPPIQ